MKYLVGIVFFFAMSAAFAAPPVETQAAQIFTKDEVSKHNSSSDIWVIIHGKVYDITKLMGDHPGGPEILEKYAGQDATEEFEATYHSVKAVGMMKQYYKGDLE